MTPKNDPGLIVRHPVADPRFSGVCVGGRGYLLSNDRKSRHRRINKQIRFERLAATSLLSLCQSQRGDTNLLIIIQLNFPEKGMRVKKIGASLGGGLRIRVFSIYIDPPLCDNNCTAWITKQTI